MFQITRLGSPMVETKDTYRAPSLQGKRQKEGHCCQAEPTSSRTPSKEDLQGATSKTQYQVLWVQLAFDPCFSHHSPCHHTYWMQSQKAAQSSDMMFLPRWLVNSTNSSRKRLPIWESKTKNTVQLPYKRKNDVKKSTERGTGEIAQCLAHSWLSPIIHIPYDSWSTTRNESWMQNQK